MDSEILKALIGALGGEADELFAEFGKFAEEYPNLSILLVDFIRNGAQLVQEVDANRNNMEVLKQVMLDAGVMVSKPVNQEPKTRPHEDMKIGDIIWHQHVGHDDGDLPN